MIVFVCVSLGGSSYGSDHIACGGVLFSDDVIQEPVLDDNETDRLFSYNEYVCVHLC